MIIDMRHVRTIRTIAIESKVCAGWIDNDHASTGMS